MIELAHLTEAQIRAYCIADNQLALNAGWDVDLLSVELSELQQKDFDLGLIGFDEKQLEAFLRGKGPGEQAKAQPILRGADLEALAPSEEELARLQGRKIMVEFSGGKDSSAAAVWVKRYLPAAKTVLVYVDMGAEHIGFFFFLQRFAEAIGIELMVLRAKENIISAFLSRKQWPAFGFPWCHELLREPLDEFLRSHAPSSIACVRGGRLKEKARRSKAQDSRFLVIERMPGYTYFQPVYYTDKEAAEKIVEKSGLPIWGGYAAGLQRTACRICPGQKQGTYATIRAKFPEIWEELLELERRFGAGCWRPAEFLGLRSSVAEMADRGLTDPQELSHKGNESDASEVSEL